MSTTHVLVSIVRVVLLLLMVPQATAARTLFNPALEVSRFYSSNVFFTAGDDSISDSFTSLALVLPVTRGTPRTDSSLAYSATVQRFDSFDSLDNLSHNLQAAVDASTGKRSEVSFGAFYSKSQNQGTVDSVAPQDQFLTPRSEREDGRLGLEFVKRFSESWAWRIEARYQVLRFSSIGDVEGEPSLPSPENRSVIGALAEISKSLSSRTGLGIGIGSDRVDLELSGVQNSERLFLSVLHEFSRRDSLSLTAGAFHANFDSLTSSNVEDRSEATGFQGEVNYSRQYSKLELRILGFHGPTSGGDLPVTSINSTAAATLDGDLARKLNGGLAVRYSRAKPTFDQETRPTIHSQALSGSLSYLALPTLFLRLSATVTDQKTSGSDQPDSGEVETKFFQASLSLVWSPLARKPIAGGSK